METELPEGNAGVNEMDPTAAASPSKHEFFTGFPHSTGRPTASGVDMETELPEGNAGVNEMDPTAAASPSKHEFFTGFGHSTGHPTASMIGSTEIYDDTMQRLSRGNLMTEEQLNSVYGPAGRDEEEDEEEDDNKGESSGSSGSDLGFVF
ncbi:MAG: hypothetical protein Q9204_000927 [Flavoplaca sp. TL-2023a]